MLLLFLCLQQKPAYEMRISDWSSDVCSSDLLTAREQGRVAVPALGELRKQVEGALDLGCGSGCDPQVLHHAQRPEDRTPLLDVHDAEAPSVDLAELGDVVAVAADRAS